MAVIFTIILTAYCLMICLLLIGWVIVRRRKQNSMQESAVSISVVIAMRNESGNIEDLFNDLAATNYPKHLFEIIFVNDHSTDDTLLKVMTLSSSFGNISVLDLPKESGGKKAAIQFGINMSRYDIIVTTDADCRVSKNWLKCIASGFQSYKTKMIAGAVKLIKSKTFFSRLQSAEFMSLVGTTASAIGLGHPVMCNGANLAYRKEVFKEVNGYDGNIQVASGDDEFLMRKIFNKYPDGISFLNFYEAVVSSQTQRSLKDFFQQRLRWAGKWKYNSDWISQILAVFIVLSQISFLSLIVISIFQPGAGLVPVAVKLFLEAVLLIWVGRFLDRNFDVAAFVCLQIIYPFYVMIVGFFSLILPYRWKNRNYK